jgi:hypothetical protein
MIDIKILERLRGDITIIITGEISPESRQLLVETLQKIKEQNV